MSVYKTGPSATGVTEKKPAILPQSGAGEDGSCKTLSEEWPPSPI